MTESGALTLAEFLVRSGVPGVPSALYLSAGRDTMPFTFLSPAFLAHRGVEGFEWPQVFVYVDKEKPRGRGGAALAFEDDRGTVVQTMSMERLTVGGFPAWLLDVRADARDPESSVLAKVLRIRAENHAVFPLVAEAAWTPDVVITVRDGCAHGFQQDGRCENELASPISLVKFLTGPPRWWVTDHWRPKELLPDLGDGPAWEFHRVGPLSSEWGWPSRPLHGANLFEVRR